MRKKSTKIDPLSQQKGTLALKLLLVFKDRSDGCGAKSTSRNGGGGGGLQQEKPAGTFEWKHNALGHSFISYRVAETQNVAQTALEAGNSPRVVFSNYRELVRPVDADKWFGITPKTVQGWKKAQEKRMAKATQRIIKVVPRNVLALPSAAGA